MNSSIIKVALFAVLGAVAGFTYYYFIGCENGSCMITGNPYISTVYGATAGVLLGWPTKDKKAKNENPE